MKSRILSLSSAAYLIVNTPLMAKPLEGLTILVAPEAAVDGTSVRVSIVRLTELDDQETAYRFQIQPQIRDSLGSFPAKAIAEGKLPAILPKGVWVETPDKVENSFSFVPLAGHVHPVASMIRIWTDFNETERREILTVPIDDPDMRSRLLVSADVKSFLTGEGIDIETMSKQKNIFVRGGKSILKGVRFCRNLVGDLWAVKNGLPPPSRI